MQTSYFCMQITRFEIEWREREIKIGKIEITMIHLNDNDKSVFIILVANMAKKNLKTKINKQNYKLGLAASFCAHVILHHVNSSFLFYFCYFNQYL